MKIMMLSLISALLLSFPAYGQEQVAGQLAVSPGGITTERGFDVGGGPEKMITIRREMGEWWKDSEVAKKLQLTDDEISRLNKIFYDHRLKLIDYGAEVEKSDLKLQTLLDEDNPNEDQVGTQVDQVLAARGKLEREYTMMNLDLRKVLTLGQWKKLKEIRDEHGPGHGNVFFYRKLMPGGGPGGPMPPPEAFPMPPPPPGDAF
ncbi:MAG: hypothetical protein ACRD2U_12740 [Terriglobales bacterium]